MTAITAGKVLVTGANGYIAIWVVKKLLEKGYSVRGTVRAESKGTHLKEVFKEYGDKLEIVVVEDITKDGAFDEAVQGVDAIEHTASPFHFRADDPDELIVPAVRGTTGLLRSAHTHGSAVRRVVVTSSCAAVLNADPKPRVFTEDSWNIVSVREVEEKGRAASPFDKYRASKTLAERAAWAYMDEIKADVKFDLVVLNPPFVFGPVLHAVEKAENLNSSMEDWWAAVAGKKDNEYLATLGSSWIDVRDLGTAHVLALEKEAAGGNRIVIASGPYKWQDWVNAAHEVEPTLPAGNTAYKPAEAIHYIQYDVSRAAKLLGLSYFDIKQTTADTLADFKARGWIS